MVKEEAKGESEKGYQTSYVFGHSNDRVNLLSVGELQGFPA